MNHRTIENIRLEDIPEGHLVQLLAQSKDNVKGKLRFPSFISIFFRQYFCIPSG